jgi:iron complex outermembrane receptor protein
MPATDLSFFGQVGYSWGDGKTPYQNVSETNPGIGSGAGYTLNGLGSGPSFQSGHHQQHDTDAGRRTGGLQLDLRRSEHRCEGS